MWRLGLALSLLLGAACAQAPYRDVPPGHWAEAALAPVADTCVVQGLPTGEFRGNEALTRYETAVVAGRLLDEVDRRLEALRSRPNGLADLEAEVAALAGGARALTARLQAAEGRREAPYAELSARLDAVEAEVARLRARVEGRPTPRAADAAPAPARPASAAAPAARFAGDAGRPEAPSLAGPARPWRVSAAVGAAPQSGPLLRASAGHEGLLGPAGLRVTAEVRPDAAGIGDAAIAAHATLRGEPRRYGATCWTGHAGAGAGYRFVADASDRASGAFLGVLLGAEYELTDRTALFVEVAVDVHPFGPTGPGPTGARVRPSLSGGVAYRF